jgi:hypothetical protein
MDQITPSPLEPSTPADEIGPMARPHLVIDDFLPTELAEAMRADIDRHFANPYDQPPATHDIWKYWFVPGAYVHLKTDPARVIDPERVEAFKAAAKAGLLAHVGTGTITVPHLNYFFPGSFLDWHTDSGKGSFALIYSLTRADRRTVGGNTLIMRDPETAGAPIFKGRGPSGIYHAIEPKFNRMLIIDQRVPHAVSKIEGSMDPIDGRYVIIARVGYGTPVVEGPHTQDDVMAVLGPVRPALAKTPPGHRPSHGPIGVRLEIGADGAVAGAHVLYHRVRGMDGGAVDSTAIAAEKMAMLRALRFPAAEGASTVRFLIFVGRVPDAPA